MPLDRRGERLQIDARETIRAVLAEVEAGTAVGAIASRFHRALAEATVAACVEVAQASGLEIAVLAGGVFQNRRLVEAVAHGLQAAGLRVLLPERLPPGDGAISYGQVAVAARRLSR